MKILIAPDSFKSTIRNTEAARIIAEGLKETFPGAEPLLCPMADGGEGTAETLITATGGERREVSVTGPLGAPAAAFYGLSGDGRTAFLEMASASGIELVPPSQLNPLQATTRGTGELIRAALEAGAREIIMGIGGSATVDGGAGMAQALGYRLLDSRSRDIPPGAQGLEDLSRILPPESGNPPLDRVRIRVACDVTNPLLGPQGAAAVYGPQKGADPAMIPRLEAGLARLAQKWQEAELLPAASPSDRAVSEPGDGAAGGLGAGLRAFCRAELTSGAHLVAEASGFNDLLPQAQLLITGEGKTDSQTASGKLCAVLAEKAQARAIPVVLIAGALKGDPAELTSRFGAVFSTTPDTIPLEEALARAPQDLALTARSIGMLLQAGTRAGN